MLTDAQLVRRFIAGDDLALAALYQRFKVPLYGFCLRMLGDTESAQDALQDTFLRVHQARRDLRSPEKFKSWLFTIARNYCRRYLRRQGRQDLQDPNGLDGSWPAAVETPIEVREERAIVRSLIAQLPPNYREVIILREYEQASYREIAAITGASESAVRARLFKARKMLCARLEPLLK